MYTLTFAELEKFMNDDPCEVKHGGNECSIDANLRNRHVREDDMRRVYDLLAIRPATMKEVAGWMGKQLNQVSGRASALLRLGYIERTGERREGSAVLRVVKSYA